MSKKEHFSVIETLLDNRLGLRYPAWRDDIDFMKPYGSMNDDASYDQVCEWVIPYIKVASSLSPEYSSAGAEIIADRSVYHLTGSHYTEEGIESILERAFPESIKRGVKAHRYSEKLLTFDLERLAKAIEHENDRRTFTLLGMLSLWDRYLVNINGKRIETAQFMLMRVAMGLAIDEQNREEKAILFYRLMSDLRYMPSSPTLFNAGTKHQQLSSCFISTTQDDLHSIFKTIYDNAMLGKWSGGIGNDWTNVRASGAKIEGTNGLSSGIIPFIKVVNSTTAAVNQGGKRAGAAVVYLEPWHYDIDGFLELRKNVGEERRRAHDLHTALWTPDLFFERVKSDGIWSLFCPSEAVGLHDSYGENFKRLYEKYEEMGRAGELKLYKEVNAKDLWRTIMNSLFSTGHPWICYKDVANIRSPQKHAGVIHSSNLCTEIFLNTSEEEVAVCNLGSINLLEHVTKDRRVDWDMLKDTISIAVRMLDNVVSLNYHPIDQTRISSQRHRPIGLGVCGLADMMIRIGICWDQKGIDFSDRLMEFISYHAILASHKLSRERGSYPSFEGSDWSKGVVPLDTQIKLKRERGEQSEIDCSSRMDWTIVREAVKKGMRNSTVLSIAPTATISHLLGVNDGIAPYYGVLYTKYTITGSFAILPMSIYQELLKAKIMNRKMMDQLILDNGSVKNLPISNRVKNLLKNAFEVPHEIMIEAAGRRQKWIDQGQSLNLFFRGKNGDEMNRVYMKAFAVGLKSTYYFKIREASSVEKMSISETKNLDKQLVNCEGCGAG